MCSTKTGLLIFLSVVFSLLIIGFLAQTIMFSSVEGFSLPSGLSAVVDQAKTTMASVAQPIVDQAKTTAASAAQSAVDQAKATAASVAQPVVDQAKASAASAAQSAIDQAKASAASAAQSAVDQAKASAASAAQSAIDQAKASAASAAQSAVDQAKASAAAAVQKAADDAKAAAASAAQNAASSVNGALSGAAGSAQQNLAKEASLATQQAVNRGIAGASTLFQRPPGNEMPPFYQPGPGDLSTGPTGTMLPNHPPMDSTIIPYDTSAKAPFNPSCDTLQTFEKIANLAATTMKEIYGNRGIATHPSQPSAVGGTNTAVTVQVTN